MADLTPTNLPFMTAWRAVARHRHLLLPIAFLAMLVVLIVPMPTFVMDLLICANIAIVSRISCK